MELEFWTERWEQNKIGFHRDKAHPLLVNNLSKLHLKEGDHILVPLCGKSLDMIWLHEQGFAIHGIEISKIAAEAFFRENEISGEEEDSVFNHGSLKIYCSDMREFHAPENISYQAIYDRAALVALPPKMRRDYAEKIIQLAPEGCQYFLIAFSYPQELVDGPPFSVDSQEVHNLFGEHFAVKVIDEAMTDETSPRMKKGGVEQVLEKVYLLTRNNKAPN